MVEAGQNAAGQVATGPLVSVVVACRDEGSQIQDTLDAVLAQTFTAVELIFVDRSSDRSCATTLLRACVDSRVRVIRSPGATFGGAWNAGIEGTKAPYVCCLEAGQELAATCLEECLFVLETSRLDLCVTWPQDSGRKYVTPQPGSFGLGRLITENFFCSTGVFRREHWIRAGGYDEAVRPGCENWDLWIRMARAGAGGHCMPDHLVRWRKNGVQVNPDGAFESIRKKHADLYRNPELVRRLKPPSGEGPVFSYAKLLGDAAVSNQAVNILLAVPALTMGGAEASISQLCRQLKAAGFRIFVIATLLQPEDRGDTTSWFEEGVEGIYHLPRFLESWRRPGFIFYLLQRQSIDILWQVGSSYVYDLIPAIKEHFASVTIVDLLFNPVGYTASYLKYEKFIDHVVTEHDGMKAWLMQRVETRNKISVIPNGVDLARFSPRPAHAGAELGKSTRFVVGFFGRLAEEKGPDLFLQIAAMLSYRHDLSFIICGTGPLYPALQARMQAERLADRVQFLGFVDTRAHLACCDVVVVCSRMDGRPNILMEAAAMGVPVVASRVGGIGEMIADGVTGRLCRAGDIEGFSAAILELADNPGLCANMARASRQRAEECFSLHGAARSYADLFRGLVQTQANRKDRFPRVVPLVAIQPRQREESRRPSRLVGYARTLLLMLSPVHLRSTYANARLWRRVRADRELTAVLQALFDRNYYLSAYPEVANSGIPPLLHYLFYGFRELRNPSLQFDTGCYLRQHADVQSDDLNPLLHYILSERVWPGPEEPISRHRMTSTFLPSLLFEIFSNLSQVQLKNIDYWRYPELEPKGVARVKAWGMDQCLAITNRLLLSHMAHFPSGHATTTLLGILNRLQDYERTHDSFDSEDSRQVMIKVLAFRVLTNRYMRLPQNNSEFWKLRQRLEEGQFLDRSAAAMHVGGFDLPKYDLYAMGYPMRLHAHPSNILNTFMLKQYDSRMQNVSVHASPGDIVIDGGACWGDTSLYFAFLCGEAGKVFAFEILPENLAIMEQNIKDNPELGRRIECVKRALWNRSGEILGYTSRASGTSLLAGGKDDGSVETITIDEWVKQRGLPRVDFIKLDVEGAELEALRGAEKTIRTFKPRMAVCVYHKEDDLISIPDFLRSLDCGYKLFLDHFTIYNEETIVFADPGSARVTSETP